MAFARGMPFDRFGYAEVRKVADVEGLRARGRDLRAGLTDKPDLAGGRK